MKCGVKESGKIEELQVVRDLHKTYRSPGHLFQICGVTFCCQGCHVKMGSIWSLYWKTFEL